MSIDDMLEADTQERVYLAGGSHVKPLHLHIAQLDLTPNSVLVIMPDPGGFLPEVQWRRLAPLFEQLGVKVIFFHEHVELVKLERTSE